jgi:hypothetical protein
MRTRPLLLALLSASALALPTLASTASAAPPDSTPGDARVCAQAPAGYVHCDAHVRTKGGVPAATKSYSSGYSPAQLKQAYGLTGLNATTPIAVVDAYASPNAVADLAAYRSQFGLGAANLTQYNQAGNSISSVAGNTGWGQEEMLDLEMVSAICPGCPIIYVGASSTSFTDLGTAVNTAVSLGAKVVSNSYGGSESSSEVGIQSTYYTHPNVAITVSSGDSGYGPESPAAFNTVTAVGGTTLTLNTNSSRKSTTQRARTGRSRTWPLSPTPPRASPSTTATAAGAASTGTSSAAPALRRRSSAGSTACPGTRRRVRTACRRPCCTQARACCAT